MNIEVAPEPDQKLAYEAVLDGLRLYNERFLGPSRKKDLAVLAKDEDGRIVGGATGHVYNRRLFIDLLWVNEGHRGQGIGSRVVRGMESEGCLLGATRALLDTFTFQAAPFYEKNGYREVARIPRFFGEYDRIYMGKDVLIPGDAT